MATTIGVSPQTLASVAAGLRVNASIVALVERRLAELDPDVGLSSAASVAEAEPDTVPTTSDATSEAVLVGQEPAGTAGQGR